MLRFAHEDPHLTPVSILSETKDLDSSPCAVRMTHRVQLHSPICLVRKSAF